VFDYCTLHSDGTITTGTLAECEWCWSNAAFITIWKLVAISITSAVPNICLYRLFPLCLEQMIVSLFRRLMPLTMASYCQAQRRYLN